MCLRTVSLSLRVPRLIMTSNSSSKAQKTSLDFAEDFDHGPRYYRTPGATTTPDLLLARRLENRALTQANAMIKCQVEGCDWTGKTQSDYMYVFAIIHVLALIQV